MYSEITENRARSRDNGDTSGRYIHTEIFSRSCSFPYRLYTGGDRRGLPTGSAEVLPRERGERRSLPGVRARRDGSRRIGIPLREHAGPVQQRELAMAEGACVHPRKWFIRPRRTCSFTHLARSRFAGERGCLKTDIDLSSASRARDISVLK